MKRAAPSSDLDDVLGILLPYLRDPTNTLANVCGAVEAVRKLDNEGLYKEVAEFLKLRNPGDDYDPSSPFPYRRLVQYWCELNRTTTDAYRMRKLHLLWQVRIDALAAQTLTPNVQVQLRSAVASYARVLTMYAPNKGNDETYSPFPSSTSSFGKDDGLTDLVICISDYCSVLFTTHVIHKWTLFLREFWNEIDHTFVQSVFAYKLTRGMLKVHEQVKKWEEEEEKTRDNASSSDKRVVENVYRPKLYATALRYHVPVERTGLFFVHLSVVYANLYLQPRSKNDPLMPLDEIRSEFESVCASTIARVTSPSSVRDQKRDDTELATLHNSVLDHVAKVVDEWLRIREGGLFTSGNVDKTAKYQAILFFLKLQLQHAFAGVEKLVHIDQAKGSAREYQFSRVPAERVDELVAMLHEGEFVQPLEEGTSSSNHYSFPWVKGLGTLPDLDLALIS